MIHACRTTRIYCLENCPPGRRTKPENRLSFTSRGEAEAAGFRACKVCRPDLYEGAWQPKAARGAVEARLTLLRTPT
jgi:methylphosphotriester-DNA--protein-cysteine methyltransferase